MSDSHKPRQNVHFKGKVTNIAPLRYTPSGKAVCNFDVAEDIRQKNLATEEWETVETIWRRVSAWDEMAEHCAESLERGVTVWVQGTEKLESYQAKDGIRESREVSAWDVSVSLKWNNVQIGLSERATAADSPNLGDAGVGF